VTDVIEKQMDEEQASLDARRASWRKYKDSLAGLVGELDAMKPMALQMTTADVVTCSISGDKHQLTEAVRKLRVAGFKTNEKPPAKGVTSWHPWFSRADGANVYLSFTGTSCRRVQTGTKLVEVPVYETVCDEIVLDRSAEGAPAPAEQPVTDDIPF
jgi:hypothetical protein